MVSLVKTAVIVVNFNGKAFLDRCLDSLRCQTFSHYQVIVVDNASDDGSADGIEKRFPGFENTEPSKIYFLNKKREFIGPHFYGLKKTIPQL